MLLHTREPQPPILLARLTKIALCFHLPLCLLARLPQTLCGLGTRLGASSFKFHIVRRSDVTVTFDRWMIDIRITLEFHSLSATIESAAYDRITGKGHHYRTYCGSNLVSLPVKLVKSRTKRIRRCTRRRLDRTTRWITGTSARGKSGQGHT